ncbi:putative (S)-mandelate dehydrogenase [Bordetella bronchiseptica SBL-F6116]|uniref:alpha-hydroxy acid oxidase n=1 Tax=Bordetella bronchiseptica TaxID=518 RepID=UPI0004595652|nr:alpha-hydroxy acid oxidase [Bordetella bronchiseptica]KCV32188.1 putative (S)-mandelate dehydrogenase [Bordetella bronchiseptica 00-P-2730]KDE01314.1 putative (S)-mandelate dehydrogenase [Bordetella bronchiseptica SBL-F6116]
MKTHDALQRRALCIDDLRAWARKALPKGLFEFVDRGTEDEFLLSRNRRSLDELRLLPRVMRDVSRRNCSTHYFGQASSMPMIIAPTGAAGLLAYEGEYLMAKAAARAGIPFVLSTASIVSMERVAQAGGDLWFQLYMLPDLGASYRLMDRARDAGYRALMVTLDTPVSPNREYNVRNHFTLPMQISSRNALDVMRRPAWIWNVFFRYLLRDGVPMLENYPDEYRQRLDASGKGRMSLPKTDSITWENLRALRRHWRGPLIAKGILHPEDARMARDCGVDAIVVSNHGGRNFDAAATPIEALPRIVDEIADKVEVFVDSGFRRGVDVAKALALGARGALLGRAPLWGVASAGEPGALHALELMREELLRSMAFLGCESLAALDRGLLAPATLPRNGGWP